MINFAANFGNMRKNITNVVFDFGGVIAPADLGVVIGKFRNLGVKDIEKYLNLVCQQGFFGDFETGLIGEEEFRRRVGEEAGREVTMDECRQAYMGFSRQCRNGTWNFSAGSAPRATGSRCCPTPIRL